ncbi:MAG: hypothetical protein MZV64_40345 [Ignavibacteriales bacterium]|nr:hypothetical protein [Ignavibacteriales bacterium]
MPQPEISAAGGIIHFQKILKSFLSKQNPAEDFMKYLMMKEMEFCTQQLFIPNDQR